MDARIYRSLYFVLITIIFVFFVIMASCEPVSWDGWYFINMPKGGFWDYLEYAEEGYFEGNPRVGHIFTMLAYHFAPAQLLLTPIFHICLILGVMTAALGRFPDPGRPRDSLLLVLTLALIWTSIPVPGQIFFYRPYTTNYLYGFVFQLAFLLPYRLDLSGKCWFGDKLVLMVPAALLGVVAGASNEHTGFAILMLLCFYLYRMNRQNEPVSGWSVAGAVGFTLGYAALLSAPGQTKRYDGLAAGQSSIERVLERTPLESLITTFDSLKHAGVPLFVVFLSIMLYWWSSGLSFSAVLKKLRGYVPFVLVCLAMVLVIGLTLLGSPILGPRLNFASCILIVIAVLGPLKWLSENRHVAAGLMIFSILTITACGATYLKIYSLTSQQFRQRLELLQNAEPDSDVHIPEYTYSERTDWFRGEDLLNETGHKDAAESHFRLNRIIVDPE